MSETTSIFPVAPIAPAPARMTLQAWLILVLVLFALLGFASVFFMLYIRPEQDNLPVLSILFAFLTLLVTGLFALLNKIDKKMDDTHNLVNSRMSELVAKTEQVAEAIGYNKAMREAEIERAALLRDAQTKANELLDHAKSEVREMIATAVQAARKVKTEAGSRKAPRRNKP